jgi:RNA polymerase sigma factor (TIGR02999 family)
MSACLDDLAHVAHTPPDAAREPHENVGRACADVLFSTLYTELRNLARRQLARHASHPKPSTTTLLHETYLVIVSRKRVLFEDRARFLGYAARVMRGLIVDHTRRRCAHKRGGRLRLETLPLELPDRGGVTPERAHVRSALAHLAAVDPALAELVELKVFGGFSCAEIAALRGSSARTVQRHWERARAFLVRVLKPPSRI